MFGDVAKQVLELMDFGSGVPGSIDASDVPTALANLQKGLQAIPREVDDGHNSDKEDSEDDEPVIDIHTRALPVIELLQSAVSDDNYVRWE